MIEIIGDITNVKSGIILHQVNCKGKMNSGVAKAIREKWPVVFEKYKAACGNVSSVDLLGCIQPVKIDDDLTVINMFSQLNYGYDGSQYTDYGALEQCLGKVQLWRQNNYPGKEIHHPMIGAGLGGGDWDTIKSLICTQLGETILWKLK